MSIKFTVQCCECMRIVGISSKDFQEEEIYCMKCANKKLNTQKEHLTNKKKGKKDE